MKDLAEKSMDEKDQRKLFLLEKMIESLTGKTAGFPQKVGWGLEYDYEERHFEKEEIELVCK